MSTARVCAAFVAAQAELKAIVKDSTNPGFRSRYASLDTIIDTVRPVLARHELALMQGAEPASDGKALAVSTFLVHVSGEMLHSTCYIPMVKLDAQGAGGALTYGRRYGIAAMLCLAADDDDDGNAASRPPAAKRSSPPRPVAAEPKPAATNGVTIPKWLGLAAHRPMPFGHSKGKTLGEMTTKDLKGAEKWCVEKNDEKFADLLKDIRRVLTDRALGEDEESQNARAVVAMTKDDLNDGLSFR